MNTFSIALLSFAHAVKTLLLRGAAFSPFAAWSFLSPVRRSVWARESVCALIVCALLASSLRGLFQASEAAYAGPFAIVSLGVMAAGLVGVLMAHNRHVIGEQDQATPGGFARIIQAKTSQVLANHLTQALPVPAAPVRRARF